MPKIFANFYSRKYKKKEILVLKGILLWIELYFLSFFSRCSKNKCNTTTIEKTLCLLVRNNIDSIGDL